MHTDNFQLSRGRIVPSDGDNMASVAADVRVPHGPDSQCAVCQTHGRSRIGRRRDFVFVEKPPPHNRNRRVLLHTTGK